ncbi:MAG: bifunctional hydroxymethylpyrimidine kinase/phosphomethylpyrimidine kinase [Solirubrobacterales bacterium]|nr:bifunctional hydroxymethylpyrimidine kinase/phosphomethylpyrimidine kinase [Solirubrobacterales bacterium]MCB8970389.1 bifunctional hydroxymethylpyrimidine kinase/phosphomethylpyrimidine kinase [Thermoleophilales bacterium]
MSRREPHLAVTTIASILSAARRTPVALSIAGSDSGGGAGIQADLKAFAALGVHGTTAITAITAQNTVGVTAIHPIPPEIVIAQVQAVQSDIRVDAVKVGMLGDRATIAAVAEALDGLPEEVPVVVDPVMVSESGAELLAEDARGALVELILPRADVLTPNLPEARRLAGLERDFGADPVRLAAAVRALGPGAVIVTGGHADGTDLLDDGAGDPLAIPGRLHPDGAAHGSGCTQSSSLAALLARGWPLREAAVRAREVAAEAIRRGLRDVGAGPGPVDALGIAEHLEADLERGAAAEPEVR